MSFAPLSKSSTASRKALSHSPPIHLNTLAIDQKTSIRRKHVTFTSVHGIFGDGSAVECRDFSQAFVSLREMIRNVLTFFGKVLQFLIFFFGLKWLKELNMRARFNKYDNLRIRKVYFGVKISGENKSTAHIKAWYYWIWLAAMLWFWCTHLLQCQSSGSCNIASTTMSASLSICRNLRKCCWGLVYQADGISTKKSSMLPYEQAKTAKRCQILRSRLPPK